MDINFRYLTDSLGCHQLPERSFFYKGVQFPVCARCTGVLIGQFSAFIMALLGYKSSLAVSIILMAPMGIDWGIQQFFKHESNNFRRLITGLLGGYGVGMIYVLLILFLFNTAKEFLINLC